jgi:hypothetical protein
MLRVEGEHAIREIGCGVLEDLPDVFVLELGELASELLAIGVCGEQLQYATHRHAQPPNAWGAVHLLRVDRDPIELHVLRVAAGSA